MSVRSVMLLGGPDSGKTNYVGRLWPALNAKSGSLVAAAQPVDIGFVLDTADHLYHGEFAPRSEHLDRRNFEVLVAPRMGGNPTSIVIPDIKGEMWRTAVIDSEIATEWMSELRRADGALLFLRFGSDQDVRPLDWVTSRKLLEKIRQDDDDRKKLPTQVMLCELIRYLELTMADRLDGGNPRLSVIVSAWDLVDPGTFSLGPQTYIEKEYPLLAGQLRDIERLDVKTFGLSIVGGDLKHDPKFKAEFADLNFDECGWVATRNPTTGVWQKELDLTLPVAWVVGV